MTLKPLFAAVSLSLLGATAFAAEDVRWPDASVQVSENTRAEVAAEVKQARQQGIDFEITEARSTPETRDDMTTPGMRDRAEVRAEARSAARDAMTDPDYVGG